MSTTSIIQTPTPSLETSKAYYQKLGFTEIHADQSVFFSDEKVVVEINPERFARPGIKLFSSDWKTSLQSIEGFCKPHSIDGGHIVSDPSGTWIYLMDGDGPDFKNDAESSILGNYMGVSLEVVDMKAGHSFWAALGFEITMGSAEQGWVAMQNKNGTGISLMKPMSCPHLFYNPSLTYFNGKSNLEVIAKIRESGVLFVEEITQFNAEGVADNVILRDPGGLGFFVFSD
ncbi:MAG: hypothetical protein R2813_03825 [Flavobacteriales bacterium]